MKGCLKIVLIAFVAFMAIVIVFGLVMDASESNGSSDSVSVAPVKSKPILTDSAWRAIVGNDFRVKVDEFENTSYYQHKNTPKYVNQTFIFPYLGKKEGNVWLRFKIQYAANEWLFMNLARFNVDGQIISIPLVDVARDNNSDGIYEWIDLQGDGVVIALLGMISKAKKVTVRLEGAQYQKDRTLTKLEMQAIRRTVEAYDKSLLYR